MFKNLVKLQFFTLTIMLTLKLVAFAQTPDIDLTNEEKAWIAARPVIKSLSDSSYPPFDYQINGEPVGFSIDYLNLIARKVGLEINFIKVDTWEEALIMLQNGEVDIAHSLSHTDARDDFLTFSDPYMELSTALFGRIGEKYISSMEDLVGKRIAVVEGWANNIYYHEHYPELEYVEFDNIKAALIGVSGNEADIFINTISVSNYAISKNFIPGLEIVGRKDFLSVEQKDQLFFASRKDWPLLASIIRKGMATITEQEFKKLSDKWQAEYVLEKGIGLTIEESRWLDQNNSFVVAADPTIAPIEFIDENGKIIGISGMYLDVIADKLNINFKWAGNKNWSEALEKIHSKEADILSGVIPTEERKKFLTFTDVYLSLTNVIFAREKGEVYGSMAGLDGKTIAMVKGSAVTANIRINYPKINIVEFNTVVECLNQVIIGKVDAHIGDIPITAHFMANEGLTQIVAVGETPYKTNFAMGIRSDLPYLASVMQKAMRSITPAEKAAISREWLSLNIENNQSYEEIWRALGIGFGIISVILILVWNNSLRNEVSRRMAVEEELRNSQYQARIAQAEAEHANEAKSTFLANMSHEIRTPLNAIIGFSEIMSSGLFGEISPPKYKEYAEDIKNSGEHLATVIKDILDLSKIEAGKWQLEEEEFSLEKCVKDALKMIESPAREKGIRLVYENFTKKIEGDEKQDDFITVNGDVSSIKRALINLLSNSVKFTDEGGQIICRIFKASDGRAIIRIQDNGIGIPKDRIEHVLHPFEQVRGAYYLNDEGTGLGLSIVKKIVELHDGDFMLESEENVGTSAIISLPSERVVA